MIVCHLTHKGRMTIGVELPRLQVFRGTGATGLEPATFGFGDRRNASPAQGLRPPWGQGGDGPDTRNEETT